MGKDRLPWNPIKTHNTKFQYNDGSTSFGYRMEWLVNGCSILSEAQMFTPECMSLKNNVAPAPSGLGNLLQQCSVEIASESGSAEVIGVDKFDVEKGR